MLFAFFGLLALVVIGAAPRGTDYENKRATARAEKLKRRKDERAPRRLFTLFCEGKKTEPDYFKALGRTLDYDRVQLKPVPGVGVPITIAEIAVKWASDVGLTRAKSKSRDPYSSKDQVWAVFDRDEHPRFDAAVALCEQHGVDVARSNPCFEIWLILHHEDCHAPLTRQAAQRRLEKLCPEYDRNGAKTVDCVKLVQRIDHAEARARTHLASRAGEGNPFGASSTTVHVLTKAIRSKA